MHNLCEQIAFIGQVVGGSKGWQIRHLHAARGGVDWHSACIYSVYQGFWYSVRIVTDVVFVVISFLPNLVGGDCAAVLQVNGVSRGIANSYNRYKEDGDTNPHSGAF